MEMITDRHERSSPLGEDKRQADSTTPLLPVSAPEATYETTPREEPEASDHETMYDEPVPTDTTAKLVGCVLLLTTAFLYGTLNVSLRLVYALPDPPSASALSCTRGWLATLCFVPFLSYRPKPAHDDVTTETTSVSAPEEQQHSRRPLWMVALELAVWNFGAQGLVNMGLLTVLSARAAFLTQLSVVITPVLSWTTGHAVHSAVWAACVIALAGLTFLSYTSDGLGHFGPGDLLCLGGALSWSTYIYRLSHCQGYDEIHLQAMKTFFLAILYTIWFIAAQISSDTGLWLGYANVMAWLLLFYSALGPGTIADVLQNKGQLKVSAAQGNVILSMEPVFTTVLGLLFLHEALSWQEVVGGALIMAAAVVATR